eukprot:m.82455 g.82455  ORF g.82455 m.82455 type:complete len:298 (-) comp12086_c0_seq2:271-1164(-)
MESTQEQRDELVIKWATKQLSKLLEYEEEDAKDLAEYLYSIEDEESFRDYVNDAVDNGKRFQDQFLKKKAQAKNPPKPKAPSKAKTQPSTSSTPNSEQQATTTTTTRQFGFHGELGNLSDQVDMEAVLLASLEFPCEGDVQKLASKALSQVLASRSCSVKEFPQKCPKRDVLVGPSGITICDDETHHIDAFVTYRLLQCVTTHALMDENNRKETMKRNTVVLTTKQLATDSAPLTCHVLLFKTSSQAKTFVKHITPVRKSYKKTLRSMTERLKAVKTRPTIFTAAWTSTSTRRGSDN